MAPSPPVVSAASLTTLHHVPSRFLEPCPLQARPPSAPPSSTGTPFVDTLAWILGELHCSGRRRSTGRRTAGPYYDMCEAVCSYDTLRLGLDAFGILVRGPSRL